MPTGTQSNLVGLLCHCERGDEYIVGQEAHTYKYEAGGAAVLGSIQPQPVEVEADGTLSISRIRGAIKPDDFHFARTKLLALENTIGGRVLPLAYVAAATDLAHDAGLACHLDGARLFNASVALGVAPRAVAAGFDSVSVCLSKGLGAPAGSVLAGSGALVRKARRWRKMLGGGMRQAGVLAAAGLWALDHHVERLADDHANARRLAVGLSGLGWLAVDPVQTNIVFADVAPTLAPALLAHLAAHDVSVMGRGRLRMVTHLDVSDTDIDRVIEAFRAFSP